MSNNTLLTVSSLNKSFPGVQALKNINFELKKGEVHALLGENGAGKSTFLKILGGDLQPDSGTISYLGQDVVIDNTKKARDMGIAMAYQELSLVPHLSVAENIFLGEYSFQGGAIPMIDWKATRDRAQAEIEKYGLNIDVRKKLIQLGVGEQQLVEIIRAVARDVKVLLLDEPTSALSRDEIEILFGNIIANMKEQGISIIYISHRLEEVFRISDRVTVFRDGEEIATKNIDDTNEDELIQMMVGRDIGERYIKGEAEIGRTVLQVENLTANGLIEDCSLDVRAGEIVGISGLMGAGRTEFAKTLVGLYKKDGGRVIKDGREVKIRNSQDALEAGIAYLAENRSESLVFPLSISQNITLANFQAIFENGVLNKSKEKVVGREYVDKLAIETPSPEQKVMFLSGGNQQKVILARLIYSDVDVFILDEPTRGIDVGAKIEVYNLINRLLQDDKAIILISSELPEIVSLSDRVFVMYSGTMVAEYTGDEITQENIIRSATGREKQNASS